MSPIIPTKQTKTDMGSHPSKKMKTKVIEEEEEEEFDRNDDIEYLL